MTAEATVEIQRVEMERLRAALGVARSRLARFKDLDCVSKTSQFISEANHTIDVIDSALASKPAPGAGDEPVPSGCGHAGTNPIPPDARIIKLTPPTRLEVVSYEQDGRWRVEVHGYTLDVNTGEPTRIRTCGATHDPSPQFFHDLVTTWFDHELREQLGMNPHTAREGK